jgi:integrase
MSARSKNPLRLDRVVTGVGRIQRSSGTRDRRLFRELHKMIDQLRDYGRTDILRALRDGHWAPLEVYRLYRRAGANPAAIRLERAASLQATIERWLTQREQQGTLRPTTLQMYRSCLRRVTERASPDATLDDLPELLRGYRDRARGTRSFNIARSTVLSFLKDHVGKRDERYLAVQYDVSPLPHRTKHATGLTPDEARAIAESLDPLAARIWWGLAVTGMRPSEFWGDWEVEGNLVRVTGTKTENAERVIPLLYPISRPALTYRQFNRRLDKAEAPARARSGRRCFARWMNEAGAREDVTDRYEGYSPEEYLEDDRQRLRAFIGTPPSLGLAKTG